MFLPIVPKDVEAMQQELARPLAQLRWCVDFAFLDWDMLPTHEVQGWLTGLVALTPETAGWEDIISGPQASIEEATERVYALQARLRAIFEAVIEGVEPVVLFSAFVRLTWTPRPPMSPGTFGELFAGPTVPIAIDVSTFDADEHVLFCVALLLRQYPDRIRQCIAPRTRRMKHNRPQCGVIFCGRPQQMFCTPVCAARTSHGVEARKAAKAVEALPATG